MSKHDNEYVEIDCDVKRVTASAVLINDGYIEAWIPQSQMEEWPDEPCDGTTVSVKRWIAEREGLV